MGLSQMQLMLVYSIAVITVTYVSADDVILQKRSARNRNDMDRFMEIQQRHKKPFCNAFTGCGRKRSAGSLSNFVDFNNEPAVEEISKEILTEAKLWEALEEARAELQREREEHNPRDLPIPLAMSGFRRKRSAKSEEDTRNATNNNKVVRQQKR